jgi:hypothetical protein
LVGVLQGRLGRVFEKAKVLEAILYMGIFHRGLADSVDNSTDTSVCSFTLWTDNSFSDQTQLL